MYKTVIGQFSRLLVERPLLHLTPASFSTTSMSMAGHSKWQNIKHTKEANDLERNRTINKFHRYASGAIREHGSSDPKVNTRLAQIIQEAREQNIPMASLNRIIEGVAKTKEKHSDTHILRGPGRCLMVIDLYTDNRQKAKSELNSIVKKFKACTWLDVSALRQFECYGKVTCSQHNGSPIKKELLDDSISHAVEAGAEDVTFENSEAYGDTFVFKVTAEYFNQVKGALGKLGYNCVSSEIIYSPLSLISLSPEDLEEAGKLYTKLSNNENVINVFDNIEITD